MKLPKIKGKLSLKKGLKWAWKAFWAAVGLVVVAGAIWALIYRDAAAYLLQSAKGQSELLFTGQPITTVLENPSTPAKLKQNLRLVQEVKEFAEKELKLRPTENYKKFVNLKRNYLVLVVTASPPLKMESHTWWFPIVGTVPYKGFFNREMAQAEEAKLKSEGFETHMRSAPAYSTLGWFHDPLISTMMDYGDYYLINTVIHESVHATLWVPGEVTFNENMASFIGNEGALKFIAHKYGQGSDKYKEAVQKLHDQKVFADFIAKVYKRLKAIYDSDRFDANKMEDKKAAILELKRQYVTEVLPKIRSKGYAGFEKQDWNNALIMSYQHYNQDQEKLQEIYDRLGKDIPRMMDFLKQKDVLQYFRQDKKDK